MRLDCRSASTGNGTDSGAPSVHYYRTLAAPLTGTRAHLSFGDIRQVADVQPIKHLAAGRQGLDG